MRKYDSYKPTKIEFLDEIPEHWEEKRMRFLGYLYGGLSGKSATDFNQLTNEGNKYFIPFTNIANNFRIDPESLQTVIISENENQNKVQKGDLFFLMSSENYDDVGKTAVLIDDLEETYLNSFCKGFRITKEKIVPEFLNYQLHSKQLRHNLLTGANGFTRINLKIDKVIDLLTAIPTPEEQIAIADYLDRKTAEIDELIADKKRLLELYEEEKSTIINQAVTKGINPDVPMKDSGIEWLGEIPEHWDLKKIGYCGKIVRGGSPRPTGDPRYFFGDYIHWITVKEVTNAVGKYVVDTEEYLTEEGSKNSRIIEPETLLLSNSGATLGVPKISKIRGCINDGSVAFPELKSFLNRDYLYYFFVSHTDIYREQMAGNGQPNLNTEIIKSTFIPVPSTIEEQTAIVEFIEIETLKVDAKKAKTEKLIELLTEYRTALISEVVTGKIKVVD